jgi:hypothetical protein
MLHPSELNKKDILNYLSGGVCKVHFRKVTDGRFRSLYCTLSPTILPREYQKYINEIFYNQLDLILVYDIIDKTWKSFYIQSILYFYTPQDLYQSRTETEKIKNIKKI